MTAPQLVGLILCTVIGFMVILRVEILSPRLTPVYQSNRLTRRFYDFTALAAWWWGFRIWHGSAVHGEHLMFLAMAAVTTVAQVVSIVVHSWRTAVAEREAEAHQQDAAVVREEVRAAIPDVTAAAKEGVVEALGRFDTPPPDYQPGDLRLPLTD